MAYITDPKEIEQFMQGVQEVDYTSYVTPDQQAAQAEPQGQSWGLYNSDDGSIWETAKQRLGTQFEALVTANVENPDLSNYAQRRFVDQYKDWKSESEKLGMGGNLAAGAVGYGPSILAGMANPALGGAVMAAQSTPDALIAQYEEGNPMDMASATRAGMQSAATDVILGGMGKFIPKPGSGAMGTAKAIGAQTLAEDVTSNMASQVYENLAAGRDWNQDVGTAAVVGGVAGAGLRGSFEGISKAMNIPFNKGGESAITRATDIERKTGEEINPTFANSYVDAANAKSGIRQEIEEIGDIDSVDLADAVNRYNEVSNASAVQSAQAELGEIIPDLHMTLQGYNVTMKDINGNDVNLGRDVLGLTDDQMRDSKIRISDTRNRAFEGEGDAANKGLTQEAFNFKLAESYNKKFTEGNGNIESNLHYVKERMRVMKAQGAPKKVQSLYNDLNIYMKEYAEAINKRLKTPSKSAEMGEVVRDISSKINSAAIKLGEDANLKSFRGEKGDFDATRDYLVVSGLHDSAVAQNPKYVFGVADPLKVAKDSTTLDSIAKTALSIGTVGALPAIKGATNLLRRRQVKKDLAQAKDLGRALVQPKRKMEDALAQGNGPAAKEAAVEGLVEQGINVPTPVKTEAPVVETPVVREPTPEPLVEAPVTPVESVVAKPSVDAKTKAKPSEKAVEAVVEEAPAPKPKAKAKARKAPAKKEVAAKEEPVKPTPEEIEANKAAIALALQEAIKNKTAKRGVEAKAAKAPSAKQVEETPVIEAAPVQEAPQKAPAEPLARKTPKRTAKETEAVESVVEAPVKEEVAPKEKPKAKSRKAPKQKEVEPEVKSEPESAPEARREPLGRKQPTRTQEEANASESVTEAPVKAEEEVKVEEPAAPKEKPFAQRIREPLQKILDTKVSRKDAAKFNTAVLAREQAKQDLKDIARIEGMHKDYTPEDVARVIHEIGGMPKLREAAKDAEITMDQYFKARLLDLEGLRKREAAAKTREMKELLTSKPETKSAQKADEGAVARKAQKEFDGEMEARGYHADDVAQVNDAIEKGMSHKNARVLAQRLNAERKDTLKQDIKDQAETLKEANAVLKNQGKKAQVDEYLKGMNIEGDKEITKMVNSVFKHRSDEVKPKEMQNLLNRIDRHLDSQREEYESLMRAGGKADPRYPEWSSIANALRSSQSDLKRNRAQVDRKYNQMAQESAQASSEHAKLVKDYEKLFDQADTRDANANKVVKQKDELVRDLEDKGFSTEEAESFANSTFFKRETTPMNEREMQRTINKFVDQKAKEVEAEVDTKAKAVKAKVAEADDATLSQMAEEVADEVAYSTKMDGNVDEVAMVKAIANEMDKRDNKLAGRYKAFVNAVMQGVENRTKFPDSPELWVSANALQDIQKSFGSGTSSYAGRMGVALKLALTGNKEGMKGFGTLDQQVINSRIKKTEGSEEGKFLTGMDDLIVK